MAFTVAINKVTGEFAFAIFPAMDKDLGKSLVRGRCLKN
jgi:hypothetical protein